MKKYLLLFCCCLLSITSIAQSAINGKVVSATDGKPLSGVTIKSEAGLLSGTTNSKGQFNLQIAIKDTVIIFSYVGFNTQRVSLKHQTNENLLIELTESSNQLKEVVVSTGYQQIPKERATGSFVQLDNGLLNRSVSPDIISRLADVTSGLIFNRDKTVSGTTSISIRGQSTINSNAQPLIVLDNFPYEGDYNDINPNDVESITILKDAAAASIWGARAGNGVIVINTKKGKFGQKPVVSFNTNLTIGQKPNQYYLPAMSSSDYIEVEKKLFAQGYYTSLETDPDQAPLTPIVELLIAARDGKIAAADANTQIEALKSQDVRKDIDKYLNRVSINQQYALNISGGTNSQKYFISGGFDKDLANAVGNQYTRQSINASNTYSLFSNKLNLTTGIIYSGSQNPQNALSASSYAMAPGINIYPYAQFADANGNALAVTHNYRNSFIQGAQQQGLLDWTYKPLDELRNANNQTSSTDYRLNLGLNYKIIPGLNLGVLYQYGKTSTETDNVQSQSTFYTRDLINTYTQVNPDGSLSRAIPLGGIFDKTSSNAILNNLRAQLNYHKEWSNDNELTAIVGSEIRDLHTIQYTNRLYGYDSEHATSQPVDYVSMFTSYADPAINYNQIPNLDAIGNLTDRYLSYFANAAYTYKQRYTLSASGRLDQSNLFGVKTNQKGVPLYSAGLGYTISKEPFYHLSWLPYLKLRTTFGYNGNINKNLSAYTTALILDGSGTAIGQPYAAIINPPNPELRWERIQNINFGLDFDTKNGRLGGTIEFYLKKGIDLIGKTPYPPQTGILTFTGNYAGTSSNGVDLTLNSINIDGKFRWSTNFLFSYIHDKVTKYLSTVPSSSTFLSNGSTAYPVIGNPLYGIYSYQWAGLDPITGDPQGYLNGAVSKDYAKIISSTTPSNLVFNGSARPVTFGAIRNTFAYGRISVSANISYRLGYYVRNNSVNYGSVLSGNGGWGDYRLRWQKSGDEKVTQVPSMPEVNNNSRNTFYQYASVLVEKGDNVRLQDINISYLLPEHLLSKISVSRAQVYVYTNNIGIIWKAAKGNLDPDYQSTYQFPPVKTIAIGIKADIK